MGVTIVEMMNILSGCSDGNYEYRKNGNQKHQKLSSKLCFKELMERLIWNPS